MPSWAPNDGSGSGTGSGSGSNSGGSGGGTKGGSGAPGAAAAGQTGGRRGGLALDFRRGKTAKDRLQVEWTYPVWKPEAPAQTGAAGGSTVVAQVEHALPADQAYHLVAGEDRRPLLVLRECDLCKGTDHAFLSRTLDNEPTVLLSHWFRCVKLPTHVTDSKHPLFALFQRSKEGEPLPHLFFCDPDGSNRTPLPGDQTQGQLWETMYGFLDRCYQGDAKKAIKELRALLNQFDRLDTQEVDIRARIDREVEKKGADSDKLPKFEAELAKLAKEREALFVKEQKLRALALKDLAADEGGSAGPKAPAAAPAPAGGGER